MRWIAARSAILATLWTSATSWSSWKHSYPGFDCHSHNRRPPAGADVSHPEMPPRTQYAKHGDLNIAYQVTGDRPIDIVIVPSFVSNVEFWWAHPAVKAWTDRLSSFARLILFDKLGTGCSDPVSGPPTLEQRAE